MITDHEYRTLDRFVKTVLQRVADGKCAVSSAHLDLMHPLTAWDNGNETEFEPWMKLKLHEWALEAE
jgi:hypothetical protein